MGGTKDARDHRRVERWIKSSGGFAHVPAEAFDVLNRRLAARYRARLQCAPLIIVAVGVFLTLVFGDTKLGSEGWGRAFAGRAFATYTLIAIAGLLMTRLTQRAEREIGQTLPSRTTRTAAVPLRMMLGRVRLAFLVTAITVEGALVVVLLVAGEDWFAGSFLAAYAITCTLVALGVSQAAGRATLAMDPVSLAMDERLRSEDAFNSALPLESIIFAFPSASFPKGSSWLDLVWLVSLMLVLGLGLWAKMSRPWDSVRLDEWAQGIPIPEGNPR